MDQQNSETLPPINFHPELRYLPFPLTNIQQAYWVGRGEGVELGGVSTHYYHEVDCQGLDLQRLTAAWNCVIDRHDMLRAIVLPAGQQQVLEEVPPYECAVLDLRNADKETVAAGLAEVRDQMSHLVLPSDQWPLFEIRATLLGAQRFRLHLSFDALMVDARSRNLILYEWSQLYQDLEVALPPLELTFRDFVMAEALLKETSIYQQAETYWDSRVASLPSPPELIFSRSPSSIFRSRFKRLEGELNPATWGRLKEYAYQYGLRPSALLLTAFSECLKPWCRSPQMTLNVTLFNKMARDSRLGGVVGDFTSTLPLAVDNESEDTFVSRALCIQRQLEKDLVHSALSGVQMIRKLLQQQRMEFGALMPVVFTSLLSLRRQTRDSAPTDWLGESSFVITQTPQVALDHQVRDIKGALVYVWDVVEELFPVGMLQDMMNTYTSFLKRLAEDEQLWQARWSEEVTSLLPETHRQLYDDSNATDGKVPTELLHEPFLAQSAQRPSQLAVVSSDRKLTYAELADYSARLGNWLRNQGAQPNKLVAVVMEKGWEQVVAVLGVLQSGAAYVPIDPSLPKERLWYLLDQAQVDLAVTQPCIEQMVEWPTGIRRFQVSDGVLAGMDATPLPAVQVQDDLAYVIFTSGSTGQPKGVMIDQRGPVNTIHDINQRFHVGPDDRVLALSSLSFDLSVYDIFGTLAAGGTIVMPDASELRDPACWAEAIKREQITVWNSVPALMNLLVDYLHGRSQRLPVTLRLTLLSGDWIPLDMTKQMLQWSETSRLISLGGATEASIWSILYPVEKVDDNWKSIPYGRALDNQRMYVFNDTLEPCPIWVPGQIYIGGVGVAKGYWRDKEKTVASFMVHPHSGEQIYRTGDMGRYLPDGNIEFLGREDFQVKIQGYRIELGEVESAMEQHPAVRTCVVAAAGPVTGDRRLVGYVVPKQLPGPTPDELRQFLRQKLPEYMVPGLYTVLERLPLTPNGKVDRKALPTPNRQKSAAESGQGPEEASTTREVAMLVAQTLNQERVEPEANLLDIGINSIDMMRLALLLEQRFDFRPKMMELFRLKTVADISRYCMQFRPEHVRPREEARGAHPVEKLLKSFSVLLDPHEREVFKEQQLGLRQIENQNSRIDLPVKELSTADLEQRYGWRRSHHVFNKSPIPLDQFSEFLSCLRQVALNGYRKSAYGSAGGLYPVQTYFYAKPQRINDLPTGVYYYHPVQHSMVSLSNSNAVERDIYGLSNRPIFEQAAFGIFLVGEMEAIAPLYEDRSYDFALIEAGLISQLLESTAPHHQIGLCQIGGIDFEAVRHLFDLKESQVFLHALLGGRVAQADTPGVGTHPEGKAITRTDAVQKWEEGSI